MIRREVSIERMLIPMAVRLIASCLLMLSGVSLAEASPLPVYVHMNGKNDFLESVVAVRPGQPVVFVNEDTGKHAVAGYNPQTGHESSSFNHVIPGTPGAGHKVHTYQVSFQKQGFHFYYCFIHARLQKVFGQQVQPAHRQGIPGYKGAMAGVIVVTNDTALIKDDPPTSHRRILPNFFGG